MALHVDPDSVPNDETTRTKNLPRGLLSFEVIDSYSGLPMPSRLTFYYADDRVTIPTVGRFKNVIPSSSGHQTISIPTGQYHVYVSRGSEYTLDFHDIRVAEGEITHLNSTLSRVVDTTGFISSDFHVHLQRDLSDGVVISAAEGLDLFTALHRDAPNISSSLDSHLHEFGLRPFMSSMVGMEIGTGFGHFNVFPTPTPEEKRDYHDLITTTTPAHMLQLMRGRHNDVITQINHPRHGPSKKGYFNGRLEPYTANILSEDFTIDFDQTEIINALTDGVRSVDSVRPKHLDWEGYIGKTREVEQNLREWFTLLNRGTMIGGIGTTDVIINREYEQGPLPRQYPYLLPGYPRTYVHSETADPREIDSSKIVTALKERKSTSSCGPFIRLTTNLNVPVGSVVTATDRNIALNITVEAPPWIPVDRIEVIANGDIMHEFVIENNTSVVRFQKNLIVRPERDTWYLVVASSNERWQKPFEHYQSFSFTNPIFVDVDGNGVFDPPDSYVY